MGRIRLNKGIDKGCDDEDIEKYTVKIQQKNLQKKEIMWMMTILNRTYQESDWQTFKQVLQVLNVWVWFDFSQDYREQLPFRFSRSMLCPNLAAMIRDKTVKLEDLKAFSRQLQCDVRTLLGDESVFEEFYGLTIEEDETLGGSVAEAGGSV